MKRSSVTLVSLLESARPAFFNSGISGDRRHGEPETTDQRRTKLATDQHGSTRIGFFRPLVRCLSARYPCSSVFIRGPLSVFIRVHPWPVIRVLPCSSVARHPCSSVFIRGPSSVFIRVHPWPVIRVHPCLS